VAVAAVVIVLARGCDVAASAAAAVATGASTISGASANRRCRLLHYALRRTPRRLMRERAA